MKLRAVALALSLWLIPDAATANPVNMERIATSADVKGWSASLDFRGSLREGNVVRRDLGFGGAVQYRTFFPLRDTTAPAYFRNRWLLSSNLAFSTVSGDEITHNGFMHTRYTRMFIPRVGGEVFVQAQYNAFTNLRSRMLSGAGGRVEIVHRNMVRMWGGTGYMAEFETNTVELGEPHPAQTLNHRWTSYLSFQFDGLDGQLGFGNTVYVQPRLDDFTDLRIQLGTQLEARVGSVFALGADFDLFYDSRPPRGVRDTDIALTSYFRFRFG